MVRDVGVLVELLQSHSCTLSETGAAEPTWQWPSAPEGPPPASEHPWQRPAAPERAPVASEPPWQRPAATERPPAAGTVRWCNYSERDGSRSSTRTRPLSESLRGEKALALQSPLSIAARDELAIKFVAPGGLHAGSGMQPISSAPWTADYDDQASLSCPSRGWDSDEEGNSQDLELQRVAYGGRKLLGLRSTLLGHETDYTAPDSGAAPPPAVRPFGALLRPHFGNKMQWHCVDATAWTSMMEISASSEMLVMQGYNASAISGLTQQWSS
jgi:hypothetical protein